MTKKLIQPTKDQSKELILKTISKKKPETAKQLVAIIRQKYDFPIEEIYKILIELGNENKIRFTRKELLEPLSFKKFISSTEVMWYWIVIGLSIITGITLFIVPESSILLVYLRWVLGLIFLLFLPGYAVTRALFPSQMSIKASLKNIDMIERVAISFGMSLMLAPTVGLIFNYTPWGIRLEPVTIVLLLLTVIFATIAVNREYLLKQTKYL